MFAGSPIKRIGRNRMVRNCLIAAGNSGDAALVEHGARRTSTTATRWSPRRPDGRSEQLAQAPSSAATQRRLVDVGA